MEKIKDKIKLKIRKWLGVKNENHYFSTHIQRIGKYNPELEKAFQKELEILSKKYDGVPMFFIQSVKFSWKKENEGSLVHLPDEDSLHGLFVSNWFIVNEK